MILKNEHASSPDQCLFSGFEPLGLKKLNQVEITCSLRSNLKMAEQDMYSSSARTPKLQLTAELPSTGECWIPPKKIPHVKGQRRRSSKMVGGVKPHLESNPITARDARRAQTKLCVHQDPKAPQRLSQTCLSVFECLQSRHGSAVAWHRDRDSGCSRPGTCGMWPKLLEGVTISPTIEPLSRRPTNCSTIIPKKFSQC